MNRSSRPAGEAGRPVIELAGITRTYPGPPPVHALHPTDLTVGAGQYCTVVGPSGSGKSTLLNLLGLLDRPTAGTYLLDGVDTAGLSEKRRTALRGRRIGFVFQSFQLLPYRTATDNVALAHLYDAVPRRQRQEAARAALARVGLSHRLDALPTTLSGGERQRVAIARALVHRPSLLLCDEPTGNLDSATATQVLDLFDALHAEGMTLLVITHDSDTAERGQRTLTIRDGVLTETRRTAVGHG
ncbi:ABC transporter ATP-binding protein [Kitasatospora sp. NPDC001660]